jgi:hypothetical protein
VQFMQQAGDRGCVQGSHEDKIAFPFKLTPDRRFCFRREGLGPPLRLRSALPRLEGAVVTPHSASGERVLQNAQGSRVSPVKMRYEKSQKCLARPGTRRCQAAVEHAPPRAVILPMAAGKLSLYQAKRDFTKTAEPSGTAPVKPTEHDRFVRIQKDEAPRRRSTVPYL